jgi:hypothetical protein
MQFTNTYHVKKITKRLPFTIIAAFAGNYLLDGWTTFGGKQCTTEDVTDSILKQPVNMPLFHIKLITQNRILNINKMSSCSIA